MTSFFFFNDTATTEIYTLSLHDALPIYLDKPREMVQEILRVLRPGGRFNVLVYNRWSHVPLILMLKHGLKWRLWIENSTAPVHIELYTLRKLRAIFAPIRLTIKKYECYHNQKLGQFIGWCLR